MPPPLTQQIRLRLLNRQMGHHSGPVILKGHSGRAYGSISRFSPADNCHCVELTFAEYESARADLFKAMRLHARKIWEVAVVVEEEKAGVGEGAGEGETEKRGNGDTTSADKKRIAELEAMLEERREAMAEQGIVNLKLREDLDRALQSASPIEAGKKVTLVGGPLAGQEITLDEKAAQRIVAGLSVTLIATLDPNYAPDEPVRFLDYQPLNTPKDGLVLQYVGDSPSTPPVPQGTGPEAPAEPPKKSDQLDPLTEEVLKLSAKLDPFNGLPILPEVNDKTQWNPLQQIAKAEGVDLKQHKNKPSLLKAIKENRERLRVSAEAAGRDATAKLQAA